MPPPDSDMLAPFSNIDMVPEEVLSNTPSVTIKISPVFVKLICPWLDSVVPTPTKTLPVTVFMVLTLINVPPPKN